MKNKIADLNSASLRQAPWSPGARWALAPPPPPPHFLAGIRLKCHTNVSLNFVYSENITVNSLLSKIGYKLNLQLKTNNVIRCLLLSCCCIHHRGTKIRAHK